MVGNNPGGIDRLGSGGQKNLTFKGSISAWPISAERRVYGLEILPPSQPPSFANW